VIADVVCIAGEHAEIMGIIVLFIPVFMVNNHAWAQGEISLHDLSSHTHTLAAPDHFIGVLCQPPIPAVFVTEAVPLFP
jgi:hypothetical protein